MPDETLYHQYKQDRINLEISGLTYEQWLEGKLRTARQNVETYFNKANRLESEQQQIARYVEKLQDGFPYLLDEDIKIKKILGI